MSDQTGIYQFTAPVPAYRTRALIKAEAYEPVKGKPQGEPKHSCTFAFAPDSADLAAMKKLAGQVARAEFPTTPFAELAFPFQNGDKQIEKAIANAAKKGKDKPNMAHYAGKVLLTARTGAAYPPDLTVQAGEQLIDIGMDADPSGALLRLHAAKIWDGQEVFAKIKFKAHDSVGANPAGVNVYLLSVFLTGRGERVGRAPGSETWKAYRGQVSQEDPMKGQTTDEEIPF